MLTLIDSHEVKLYQLGYIIKRARCLQNGKLRLTGVVVLFGCMAGMFIKVGFVILFFGYFCQITHSH